MQGLYAYYNSIDANFNLAIDRINDTFDTQLLNDHSLDKKEIHKKKNLSVELFRNAVKNGKVDGKIEESDEPTRTALNFFDQFVDSCKKDLTYFRKNMLSEAEKIYDLYILLLILPVELSAIENEEAGIRVDLKTRQSKKIPVESGILERNRIISRIARDKEIIDYCSKKKITWKKHEDITSDFYKKILKKNQEFLSHRGAVAGNLETDREFCLLLYKELLFKNPSFNDFMESMDINWADDAEVLKSMVTKTIKNLKDNADEIEFSTLSKNWPDDREFFREIFNITIKNDREYDEIIAKKSTNWDISRIALTDRIILKMAIGEMINFPGIPVKVTINEYIELSKNFSTPKSKKFVNGILDVVSMELLDKGVIKKSGRGLIDNQ